MMGSNLSFIHAADIHLGSFLHLSNKVNEQVKNIVDNAVYTAFERIIDTALENDVDFIVFSGDVFESSVRTINADNFFYKMMKKLDGIEVYIICGNHDPYREWREMFKLPANIHMIGCEEVQTYDFIKNNNIAASIKGISFRAKKDSRNVISQFKAIKSDIPNIALFHSQLDSTNLSYMPTAVKEMLSTEGISYWALGHIHKLKVINMKKPCAVYPGIPQGRDFGEEGVGGCVLVKMNNPDDVVIKHMPVSPVVFERIEIDLEADGENEIQDITDIEDLILDKSEELILKKLSLPRDLDFTKEIDNVIKGFVVQWIIKGRGKIHKLISGREEEIEGIIVDTINNRLGYLNKGQFIHTDSVVFRTYADIPDINELVLKSPIYRELQNIAGGFSEDENMKKEVIEALGNIWDAKGDMEDEDPFKFHLDDEMLFSIIKQAQNLIAEKLYERRDSIED
jgi:DNA repair protein SbcD/Mre11